MDFVYFHSPAEKSSGFHVSKFSKNFNFPQLPVYAEIKIECYKFSQIQKKIIKWSLSRKKHLIIIQKIFHSVTMKELF